MKDNRVKKLELIQKLTKNLVDRYKRNDDLNMFYIDDEERETIKQEVEALDNEIERNIVESRKLFKTQFVSFKDSEICLIIFVYASAFSSELPRRIDSRDLETVVRGNPNEIIEIIDSLESKGTLQRHLDKRENGRGFEIQSRSFVMLHEFILG